MDYTTEYWEKNPGMHIMDSQKKADEIIKMIKGKNIKSILDVACGAGVITNIIKKHTKASIVVGIDISNVAISKAIEYSNGANINWIVKDIFNYKCDKKYDLIICMDVVEHIDNDIGFLRKLSELGTNIVIKVPIEKNTINNILRKFTKIDPWKEAEKRYGHIHHYSNLEFSEKLKLCRLYIEKEGYIALPKRTRLLFEIIRVIFLPLSLFSKKLVLSTIGGFKIYLLKSL